MIHQSPNQPIFAALGEAASQPAPGPQFYEEEFKYPFSINLTANQVADNQTKTLDGDADFVWLGISSKQTGVYKVRFKAPNGRFLSTAKMFNSNACGDGQFPIELTRPILCPAGSSLNIDIEDASGSNNAIEIVFIGYKRFQTRR